MLSTIERRQKILEILSERRYEKKTNLAIELNVSRRTMCYDIEENGKRKRVVNQHKTIAAREKQNKIQEEFKNLIFSYPERREDLEKEYNAKFNQIRLPTYDGSYLKFPEMNPTIELRPTQRTPYIE